VKDLLANAVAAHGGLDRWNRIRAIRVDAAITGAFWEVKGKAEDAPFLLTWPGFVCEEIAPSTRGADHAQRG